MNASLIIACLRVFTILFTAILFVITLFTGVYIAPQICVNKALEPVCFFCLAVLLSGIIHLYKYLNNYIKKL